MNSIKKLLTISIFGFVCLIQTALAQISPTHEIIAYTLATELSDDFNVVESQKETSSTIIHMTGNYITENTAKILVIEKIVRKYNDIKIVYPWSYYDEYLATVLQIQGFEDYEIILLINSQNSVCHLFIGVNDKRKKL